MTNRELERLADMMLSNASKDTEYPCYSEKLLSNNLQRRQELTCSPELVEYLIEGNTDNNLYTDYFAEAKSIIKEIAQYSKLTSRESFIIELLLCGYTLREIAVLYQTYPMHVQREIQRIRWKLSSKVNTSFWSSLHKVYIYHKPVGVWNRSNALKREDNSE